MERPRLADADARLWWVGLVAAACLLLILWCWGSLAGAVLRELFSGLVYWTATSSA
jgi:hypothetical protein